MFWGIFAGRNKGPGLFWEKEWGTITGQSYRERINPVVDEWIQTNGSEDWIFMQDNAPCHKARATMDEIRRRGIKILDWPAMSPDLNPIEHVWAWMKDYIQNHYPRPASEAELKRQVLEAWNAVPEDFLLHLVHSMPRRINMVASTGGGWTQY
jgi:transposase